MLKTVSNHHSIAQANRQSVRAISYCCRDQISSQQSDKFFIRQTTVTITANKVCPIPCYKTATHTHIHTVPRTDLKSSSDRSQAGARQWRHSIAAWMSDEVIFTQLAHNKLNVQESTYTRHDKSQNAHKIVFERLFQRSFLYARVKKQFTQKLPT